MSVIFIDRRVLNQERNLDNRRKFFNKVKSHLLSSMKDLGEDAISDIAKSKRRVTLSDEAIEEPFFTLATTGVWKFVVSGNSYIAGDQIGKPSGGSGPGEGGEPSEDGDGEDDFVFEVNSEEFLQLFFEDLELPNMQDKMVARHEVFTWQRKGFATSGAPANMDLRRTIKNSLGRRIALRRPKIEDLVQKDDETEEEFNERVAHWKRIPYIDPQDQRFRNFEQLPVPSFSAVVFFLMDVSGSMSEHHKDLAKRFFMLKYYFLQRKYTNVEIVYISHTHVQEEVDEQDFFYSTKSGGTLVLPALQLVSKIIQDRFPLAEWNVYIGQASDGDCFGEDGARCVEYLHDVLLSTVQYMSYLNVDRGGLSGVSSLEKSYKRITRDNFSQVRASHKRDIFPVFHKLFSRNKEQTSNHNH